MAERLENGTKNKVLYDIPLSMAALRAARTASPSATSDLLQMTDLLNLQESHVQHYPR
jgi:hypothetical protein